MTQFNKQYDLEERTALFGENIIRFCKGAPQNYITHPLLGSAYSFSNKCWR